MVVFYGHMLRRIIYVNPTFKLCCNPKYFSAEKTKSHGDTTDCDHGLSWGLDHPVVRLSQKTHYGKGCGKIVVLFKVEQT